MAENTTNTTTKKKTLKDLNQSATMEKGSGSDVNSDMRRLSSEDNLIDKTVEDTFPASDAPQAPQGRGDRAHSTHPAPHKAARKATDRGLPADFKDNKAAQFEYGRRSEASTLHFDTSTNRLEMGNPDVGDIDMGIIEANRPAKKDDNNSYTRPHDDRSDDTAEDLLNPEDLDAAEGSDANDGAAEVADKMANRSERRADVDRQNEY